MKPISKNQDASINASTDALSRMDELVNRRGEINQRVADKTSAIGALINKRNNLRFVIRDLQDKLQTAPKESYFDEKRQSWTAELMQAEQDYEQAEIDCKNLNEEIYRLQTIDLPACMVSISAESVVEHYRRIEQAKTAVASIQAVIDTQNQFVAETIAAIPKAVDRQQKRHSIMADIALGNATEGDLKELDALIEQDKEIVTSAQNNADPLIANARATLSGLNHKLVEAKNALTELESKSAEVSQRYFLGEAEEAAVQYVYHALHLKELHLRLLGLNWVSLQYDKRGFIIPGAGEINIPMFMLTQFEGLGRPDIHDWTLLNGAKITNDQVVRAAKAELLQFDSILNGLPVQ